MDKRNIIKEKNTLDLIHLYLELDNRLVYLYHALSKKRSFPQNMLKMWRGLEKDEIEHIHYWQYLAEQQYGLKILTLQELEQNIERLNHLIQKIDSVVYRVENNVISMEEAFDQTMNVEFMALGSPMQKVFYTHDIIVGKNVFNPKKKYERHIKRVTDIAQELYEQDSLKLTLVNSYLRLMREKDGILKDAVNDILTGVKTRRYFFDNARFLLDVARRENKHVAVVVIDVNRFKEINDTYGHISGDKVLKGIGKLLKKSVRTSDIAARYGGDEFSLFLYNQDEEKTEAFLARLRTELAGLKINVSRDRDITPGVSVGYIIRHSGEKVGLDKLLSKADKKMYENKREISKKV